MTTSLPPDETEARRERRARPRRSAAGHRAAWMAARARNAARRGGLIAMVGGFFVVAMLLVLILLPREVNRALRAQLESIPAPTDTLPLLAALDSARTRRSAADGVLAARRAALLAAATPRPTDSITGAPGAPRDATRDSLAAELGARITRARAAPVMESYRAVAEARLVRDNARVRSLVDSLEQVDREREAYAALGGPDARYASLTARVSALGARLLRAAEESLGDAPTATPPSTAAAAAPGDVAPATAAPGVVLTGDSIADSIALARAAFAARASAIADSTLTAAAQQAADSVARVERTVDSVRRANADIERRQNAVRTRSSVIVPPMAMLLAALVVGLALGYAGALVIETRRPTVGDEGEVERLAQARVITHTGAPAALRETRSRRRADRALPAALDSTAEAWQQLHLTLTGLGDVVRTVRVVSDEPMLGATLALNLGAAAAHESRATLIVELPTRTPVLGTLLRQPRARGWSDVLRGNAELREVLTETPVGRDAAVDVLQAGSGAGGASGVEDIAAAAEELRRVAGRYDLTIVVGDAESGLRTHDLIVCGRLGVTSLVWLSRVTQQARGAGHRLRAVLLWATDLPVA